MYNFMFPSFNELIDEMFKNEEKKKKKLYKDGMSCEKCNYINPYMTEPNQEDGTYVCYKCRKF